MAKEIQTDIVKDMRKNKFTVRNINPGVFKVYHKGEPIATVFPDFQPLQVRLSFPLMENLDASLESIRLKDYCETKRIKYRLEKAYHPAPQERINDLNKIRSLLEQIK